MLYLNYGASVLALLVLAAEVWFVLKRNRQIKVKGKDDFFSFALVLLFCMAIFPPTQMETLLESFRNVVILMAVFGSLAVKRGISDRGMEKLSLYGSLERDPADPSGSLSDTENDPRLRDGKKKMEAVLSPVSAAGSALSDSEIQKRSASGALSGRGAQV